MTSSTTLFARRIDCNSFALLGDATCTPGVYKLNFAHPLLSIRSMLVLMRFPFRCGLLVETLILADLVGAGIKVPDGPCGRLIIYPGSLWSIQVRMGSALWV